MNWSFIADICLTLFLLFSGLTVLGWIPIPTILIGGTALIAGVIRLILTLDGISRQRTG